MAPERLTRSRRARDITLAAIVTVLWAATLVPLFDFATTDKRLLEGFSIDELIQLNLLQHAASAHTFALHFGPYGHLVFNLILVVLRLLPGAATDARILYIGRSINLVFGAATALIIFVWARRMYGRLAAWTAFSLVILNVTLYVGVTEVQPDIVQLFFLMVSLALTVRLAGRPEMRWLVLASMTAGLAFACKYSGLFVLPIIAIAVMRRPIPVIRPARSAGALRLAVLGGGVLLVAASFYFDIGWIARHLTEDGRIDSAVSGRTLGLLTIATRGAGGVALVMAAGPWMWRWLQRWTYGLAVVWSWSVALTTFVAAFVIASPFSLRKAAFIKGLLGEAGFAAPVSLASELGILRGIGQVVGWPAACVASATAALLLWRARPRFQIAAGDAVLMAWVVIYTVVLLLPAHEIYLDYALPLVPVVALLAGRGAGALLAFVTERASARRAVTAAVLTVLVLAADAPLAGELIGARAHQLARTTESSQAYVAKWLQCRAPASSRIAYDYFVYVPSTFPNAFVTWGGTEAWLASINPDIVVTQVATAGYAGEAAEHLAYYTCLARETCGYEQALRRDDLIVYVRQGRRDHVLDEDRARLTARGCS